MGRCDTDPLINQAKLVIQLDSSRHYEEEHTAADVQRDAYLKEKGLTVLRIPNNAVTENFSGVCEAMIQAIQEKPAL